MSFSINEAKIAEMLASSGEKGYSVSGIETPSITLDNAQMSPACEIHGTVYHANPNTRPNTEPVFGTHAREAVEIVKDWIGKR
jgi:hypothetical protein